MHGDPAVQLAARQLEAAIALLQDRTPLSPISVESWSPASPHDVPMAELLKREAPCSPALDQAMAQ
eukprot:12933471-Prorocentrum_lima.AAC.1